MQTGSHFAFSFRGASPPDPLTRGYAPGPHWRHRPQAPFVEFYLYPTVGTVLIHSVKPELTE